MVRLFALFLNCIIPALAQSAVPRADCFPIERLPAAVRPRAEELFLRLLDSEAVYTVLSNLKPMSSGFAQHRFKLDQPVPAAVDVDRQALAAFRCGDRFVATIHHFAAVHNGERYADATVLATSSVRELIARKPDVFSRWGLSPHAHPVEVLMAVEYDNTTARLRGYGTLFGYPDDAVRFFVAAADTQKSKGEFVKREFVSIPTFARPERGFVWAVPMGHAATAEEQTLKDRATQVLDSYRKLRAEYIGPGKPGVVALLRSVFCAGEPVCAAP